MNQDILDLVMLTPGPRGRIGLPCIFWGGPGIAKTSKIEQATRRNALALETLLLAIRDPSDVCGVNVLTPEGVMLAATAYAKRLIAAGEGVLFLDELSCAAPATQAAALRIVAEGVVGDTPLPKEVRVLAAANPEEQAAGGWALTPPMANRLMHFDCAAPDAKDWADWLVNDGAPVEDKPRTLDPAAWARHWTIVRAGVAAYMRAKPASLYAFPDDESQRGRAWQSPRSWELAARALAGALALGLGDGIAIQACGAAVGTGAAAEAWEYLSKLDLPDPEEVIAGRAHVPTDRGDRTYATLSAVIQTVMRDNPADERRVRGLEIAHEVAKTKADIAGACARPLLATFAPLLSGKHAARTVAALAGPLKAVADALRTTQNAPAHAGGSPVAAATARRRVAR